MAALSEDAGQVGVGRVLDREMLDQAGRMAVVGVFQGDVGIGVQVCHTGVHVGPGRDEEGIAGLAGVHHHVEVLQTSHVARGVVERQVHVVGEVGEDFPEVLLEDRRHLQVGLQVKHRLDLRAHVGHQLQLVAEVELVATVGHVLIHEAVASGEDDSPEEEHAEYVANCKHYGLAGPGLLPNSILYS